VTEKAKVVACSSSTQEKANFISGVERDRTYFRYGLIKNAI